MENSNKNPYVGPRPFKITDKTNFFGRDNEIDDLVNLTIAYNTVLLYAPSGTGKTSILQAGVIPKLTTKHTVYEMDMKASFTPSLDLPAVQYYVEKALMRMQEVKILAQHDQSVTERNDVNMLALGAPEIDAYGDPKLIILVFDQFEAMFSSEVHWEGWQTFFETLAGLLKQHAHLRAIIALREEYVAQLETFGNLLPTRLQIRYRLKRLDRQHALDAIRLPLNSSQYQFEQEDGLEELLNDLQRIQVQSPTGDITYVTGKFVEALVLQVVCNQLWEERDDRLNRLRYRGEQSGDLDRALIEYYDQAIDSVSHFFDEEKIRNWFEYELITVSQTRDSVPLSKTKNIGRHYKLPQRIVEKLEDARLIQREARDTQWYELPHDRFVGPILQSNKVYREKMQTSGRQETLLVGVSLITAIIVFLILFLQQLSSTTQLALLVMTSGALGSLLSNSLAYVRYFREGRFIISSIPFYILQPFIGGILALIFYLVIQAGFFQTEAREASAYGFGLLGILVGWFSDQILEKLMEVGDTMFAPSPVERNDI